MPLLDDFDLTGALKNMYGAGGVGDPLISIGAGLLSRRGMGPALAQGFQNAATMSQLATERNRQAALDKLAQERESRQAANQAFLQQHMLKQDEINKANADRSYGLQEKQFSANQANIAADNARADAAASRPFVIGKDNLGRDIYGTMQNGVPTPVEIPQQSKSWISQPQTNLTGAEYLKTVDPEIRNQVLAIAEGRAPYPTQAFQKTPLGEQIINAVQQYEPGFDATTWAQRLAAKRDLATGNLGKNVNALNTAIGHVAELSDDAQKLNNSSYPLWNEAGNWFNTKVLGKPEVTNFNTVRDKVAEEFTRVYRGAGGSEADIKREIENLSAANSPDQLNGAIARMAALARSKIEANQEQYNKAMGPNFKPADLISDQSKKVLDLLSQREKGGGKADVSASIGNASPAGGDDLEKAREIIRLRPDMKTQVLNELLKKGVDPSGL